jgi:cytochrome P450
MRDIPAHVPTDRVYAFNYRSDPRLTTEPWTVLRELHERPPIFYSPELGGHWVVTGYDLVREVLRSHELFTTSHARVPPLDREVISLPHHVDPPEHAQYRRRVMEVFAPRVITGLRDEIRATAIRLLDGLRARGSCEFISEFAQLLPLETFLHLAGLADKRPAGLVSWVQAYNQGTTDAEAEEGHRRFAAFLADFVDGGLADPGSMRGHLLPALTGAEIDGRKLMRDEILSLVANVFAGGFDTISSQASHIMRYIAEHPSDQVLLREQPELIPDAVEELIRRFGIVSIARRVRHDVEYSGIMLKADDLLMCLITASGLDDKVFPDPMTVDFRRPNRRQHVGFGSGIHVCPGASLARLELQIMVEELLPRLPNLRVAAGADIRYYLGMATGAKSLPLEWDVEVAA